MAADALHPDIGGMSTKPNHAAIYRQVPAFLCRLRETARLTQRQSAAKIRKPQWWVARIETGSRRIDVAEFIEWCRGCGVEPDQTIRELGLRRR
jgi:hypothetical protein